MSGLFKTTVIKGNRITDFAESSATVGNTLPFGFGRFVVSGNVTFAALPPKEHVKRKRQGKGGTKTETYTYTMSYAVTFCKGPIYGFLWIKRNGKIVWTQDPNAPLADVAYAAKWKQKVTFYYGTKTQLPDSTIEAYKGTGKVSAFRNDAYFVVEDDDVTDGGGAVPMYEACVIASPPEIYVTSHPYNIPDLDSLQLDVEPSGGELRTILHETFPQDALALGISPTDGELRGTVLTRITSDAVNLSIGPTDGTLRSVIQTSAAQKEALNVTVLPSGGDLDQVLITTNPQKEALALTIDPTGGTLV